MGICIDRFAKSIQERDENQIYFSCEPDLVGEPNRGGTGSTKHQIQT